MFIRTLSRNFRPINKFLLLIKWYSGDADASHETFNYYDSEEDLTKVYLAMKNLREWKGKYWNAFIALQEYRENLPDPAIELLNNLGVQSLSDYFESLNIDPPRDVCADDGSMASLDRIEAFYFDENLVKYDLTWKD